MASLVRERASAGLARIPLLHAYERRLGANPRRIVCPMRQRTPLRNITLSQSVDGGPISSGLEQGPMILGGEKVALTGWTGLGVGAGRKTTFLSMLSSVGAVLAACSCCILPMALAGLGLSTGLSMALSPLGPARWPLTALSVLLVGGSWMVVIGQRRQACVCGSSELRSWWRTPKILMLLVASMFTLIALSWSAVEPALMRAML